MQLCIDWYMLCSFLLGFFNKLSNINIGSKFNYKLQFYCIFFVSVWKLPEIYWEAVTVRFHHLFYNLLNLHCCLFLLRSLPVVTIASLPSSLLEWTLQLTHDVVHPLWCACFSCVVELFGSETLETQISRHWVLGSGCSTQQTCCLWQALLYSVSCSHGPWALCSCSRGTCFPFQGASLLLHTIEILERGVWERTFWTEYQ